MDIIGHKKEELRLLELAKKDSCSICLTGVEGTGKKLVALSFLKGVLNDNENLDLNPDFFKLEKGDEQIKINEIRKVIEFASIKSYGGKNRAVLIDNAQNINLNAQNALLKILEEPPKNLFTVLITNDFTSLIPTIRSRVTNINFDRLSYDELKQIFPETDEELLRISNGSAKMALGLSTIDSKLMKNFAKSYILSIGDAFLNGEELSYVNLKTCGIYTEAIIFDIIRYNEEKVCDYKLTEKLVTLGKFSTGYLVKKSKKLDRYIKLYEGSYNKKALITDLFFARS